YAPAGGAGCPMGAISAEGARPGGVARDGSGSPRDRSPGRDNNAAIESWHSSLKRELGESFESMADANRRLFDYIEVFYNNQRRHKTIGQISPREFERRHAAAHRVGPVAPTASGPPFGRPADVGRSGHLTKEVIDRIEVTV